jgi:predicted phosphodiesterase
LKIAKMTQAGAVTSVYFDQRSGSVDLLLTSDVHYDSVHCNRALYKKHLEEAKRREAYIIDAGDFFDAMQGRYDNRRSYSDIRPEYLGERYYDLIVDDAAKFLNPYADRFLIFGQGNHENAVRKHASTDLNSRMVGKLRDNGSRCVSGGYGGWVILYFGDNNTRSSFRIKYFHGSGGDAPASKGTIQTSREAVYLPDADIVHNGHSHNEYTLPLKRERIGSKGTLRFDIVHFVRTPGYKDEYGDGSGGFEVERGGHPKPQGCVWATIEVHKDIVSCKCTGDVA